VGSSQGGAFRTARARG